MKLYTCSTGPRRHDFYTDATPTAAAYSLLRQLVAVYNEVLYTWWCDDDLVPAVFGNALLKPTRKGTAPAPSLIKKRANALEDRLGYEVPELLERMSQEELQEASHVFCSQTLVGFIWHVLKLERTIQHRLDEPHTTRLRDHGHAKAAGLGKGTPMKRPQVVRVAPTKKTAAVEQRETRTPMLRVNAAKRRYNPHHENQLWITWPPLEPAPLAAVL